MNNLEKLHTMAKALVMYETIDTEQIDDIMEGKTPRPPKDWGDDEPGGQGASSESSSDGSTGPIGGPASLH